MIQVGAVGAAGTPALAQAGGASKIIHNYFDKVVLPNVITYADFKRELERDLRLNG
jgi:hypothetical protein